MEGENGMVTLRKLIDPEDLDRIVDSAAAGDVVSFGISELRQRWMHDLECDIFRSSVARRLEDVLTGDDRGHEDDLARLLEHRDCPRVDVTTARLIEATGLRVGAALAIAVLRLGDVGFIDAAGETAVRVSANHPAGHAWCRTFVMLGQDVKWHAGAMLRMPLDMPDSVMTAAIGQPLRTIVSHPILDLHPHRIRGIVADAGGRRIIRLTTNLGEFASLSPDDMLTYGPPASGKTT